MASLYLNLFPPFISLVLCGTCSASPCICHMVHRKLYTNKFPAKHTSTSLAGPCELTFDLRHLGSVIVSIPQTSFFLEIVCESILSMTMKDLTGILIKNEWLI